MIIMRNTIAAILTCCILAASCAVMEFEPESIVSEQTGIRGPKVLRLRDKVSSHHASSKLQSNHFVLLMNATVYQDGKIHLLLDKETALQLGVTEKTYDKYVNEIEKL